jgi:dissimilatory sulfite reductase related protein
MNTARDQYYALELDENAFIIDADSWNERAAAIIAEHRGIPVLTEEHWKVIAALREHYHRYGVAPAMFNVCRSNGKGSDWVHKLFHSCLDAWRVAGLPDPG